LRWCLSNLYDFAPQRDGVTGDQLEEIDAWALERTAQVLEQVDKGYDDFAFHKVYRVLYDFAAIDLSAFYFDIVKDRLYTAPAKSIRRRAGQTTLCLIADALVRALAPILCFTAEEVWLLLPNSEGREPSVHLAMFATPGQLREHISEGHQQRLGNWERLVAVRNEVLKVLEIARQEKLIGSGLDAKVRLSVNGHLSPLLHEYRDSLPSLFIVSQVELGRDSFEGTSHSQLQGLAVRVEKATGEKCARCWNYSERVGEDSLHPTVCERCSAALKEIESSGQPSVASGQVSP
jgi:isoleucyl-tRNA synthetase